MIKKKLLFIFILFGFNTLLTARSAVTYTLSGGRLGDNLVAYCHAKWISYKYGIPLLYVPFEYSNQLQMHYCETHLASFNSQKFDEIINISAVSNYIIEPEKNILYVVPYFPESIIERSHPRYSFYFPVDWKDRNFKNEIQKMIAIPGADIQKFSSKDGELNIAVHVRTGVGYDISSLKEYPILMAGEWLQLKFPPFSYYIEQILRIKNLYPTKKIIINLFTDHTNPPEVVEVLQSFLPQDIAIIFDNNFLDIQNTVLRDFFSLTAFKYLIRPDANFSLMASKLGEYEIEISPWHSTLNKNNYYIDQILLNGVILNIECNNFL